ncbi:MAG: NACHT domain-containing protein, partial [Candidatus Thiodiazotropha sp.]
MSSCYGVPISDIFTPVILSQDNKYAAEEQEGRNTGDARSHKVSVTEDMRTICKKQRVRESAKISSYKEVFFKANVLQKKIFLLGMAGAGKTAFCTHLSDVWSKNKMSPQFDDAAGLNQFRYLFRVSCRFAEASESIFDMISNQLFCENDETLKVASHVLKIAPDECLVIVDGIDEWKGGAREETGRRDDIPGLPSRKGLEDCVVLSTSRPERIH